MPAGAVYVGRPTKYGNPYPLAEYGPSCLTLYNDWLEAKIAAGELDLADLADKDLACWCPLGAPCHADILLAKANIEKGDNVPDKTRANYFKAETFYEITLTRVLDQLPGHGRFQLPSEGVLYLENLLGEKPTPFALCGVLASMIQEQSAPRWREDGIKLQQQLEEERQEAEQALRDARAQEHIQALLELGYSREDVLLAMSEEGEGDLDDEDPEVQVVRKMDQAESPDFSADSSDGWA